MIESNRINREALVSVQRAFITFGGIVGASKVNERGRTSALQLNLPWENTGTTSTRKAESQVNWETFPGSNGMPPNFRFPDIGTVVRRQFLLAPKAVANATEVVPIRFIEFTKKHKVRMYVWGG